MTRKDYVEVAKILNLYADEIHKDTLRHLVDEFCDFFQEDNPRFDSARFMSAVIGNNESVVK